MRFIVFALSRGNSKIGILLNPFIVKNIPGPFFKPLFMSYDYYVKKGYFNSTLAAYLLHEAVGNHPLELKKPLLEMTRHKNANYRSLAVSNLSKYIDQETYDHIIKLAQNDPDSAVRESAILALGERKESTILLFLAKGPLKSKEIGINAVAIASLTHFFYNNPQAVSEFGKIENDLLEELKSENSNIKDPCLNLLNLYAGKSVIKDIKPLLKDKNKSVRIQAAYAIEAIEERHKASIKPSPSPTPSP